MKPPSPLFRLNETVLHDGKEVKVMSLAFALSNSELGQHCWHYRLNNAKGRKLTPESQLRKIFEAASVSYRELIEYVNK